MKRHWRSGRIILAVLLFSMTALMVYVWPRQPRWQIQFGESNNFGQILGVDEARRLLYVRYMSLSFMWVPVQGQEPTLQSVIEVRCFDLDTGKQVWSLPGPQEATDASELLL